MADEQTKDDALTPSQPQSLTRRSAALVRRGLVDALALQSSEAHYDRGLAKYDNGDYDDAINEFTKAIELDPQYPEAYHVRGLAKAKKLDYDGSIGDFTKAIEISPPFPVAYTNRGLAKYYRGDLESAIDDYSKAIELNPRHVEAYHNRGRAKRDKSDYDGAIDDFNKAIDINPRDAEAYCNRGLAKYDKGDYDGNIADYTKAIEINPRYANAYYNRGDAKYYNGDYDGAVADYNKAIEINPRHANAYQNRGLVKERKGDLDGSRADFAKAIEIAELAGADPEELIDDVIIHGWDVYKNRKPKFDDWAKEMRDKFGEESEPHLKNIYAQLGGTVRDSESDHPLNSAHLEAMRKSLEHLQSSPRLSSHPRVQRAFRNLLNYRKNHPGQLPDGKLYGEMEQGKVRASLPESDEELAKSDVDTSLETEVKPRYSDG